MATRSLNVVIAGDSKPLGVAAKQADRHMDGVSKSAGKMGNAVKAGFAVAAVGAGALAVGLKKSVDAAVEAEKSQARLKAQLKSSGASYRAHAKEIDAVIQKHSKLAGVDDEDLQDAFSGILRTTGKVSVAMKDMGLVTDLMRGKNIDAAAAGALLSKVHAGNVTSLNKMGIAVEPVTKAQDALKASTKHATDEQIKAAKAADKTATGQKGIAELQKRFGGQAEAYGKTAAGAQDRFRVAIENVQEKLGSKLLPVVGKVADAVAGFLDEIDRGTGAGGRFADRITSSFERVRDATSKVAGAVSDFVGAFQRGESPARSLASAIGAVVGGFVAFKIISTVVAGVTALKGAWAGLTGVMAVNPIGAIAIAIGAVIGALAIMRSNTRDAAAASRELNDALRAQADALRSVRDIDVDVAQRKANVASANVAVEQAEKRLLDLRKDGKATATDVKQAEADLEQARVGQKRATRDLGDAEEDSRRKREDANKATGEARKKTRELIAAKKDDLEHTQKQIFAAEDLQRKYGVTNDKLDEYRTKAKRLRDEIDKLENKDVKVKVEFVVPGLGDAPASQTGDGIGKAVRGAVSKLANRSVSAGLPSLGGSTSLQGASSALAPIAGLGSRFGLSVSSGRAGRENKLTSTGNISYHSSGEAVDLADGVQGPSPGKLAAFRALKRVFGGRLAELIYTPGGAGIKDGRSHTYTGRVAAEHMDHVHAAIDLGVPGPGIGDGPGRAAAFTGDGEGRRRGWPMGFRGFAQWGRKTKLPRQLGTGGWTLALRDYSRFLGVDAERVQREHGAAAGDSERWKYRWTGGEGDGHGKSRVAFTGDGEGNSPYSRMTRDWKNGPARPMSFDAVAALFESRGLPGVTFAQVAQGESGLDPDNIGHDRGGTQGLGLVQVTTGFNEDIIRKHGGPAAMLSPGPQADAAADVWKRQGKGAWRGTRFVKGWNLHYKGSTANVGGSSGGSGSKGGKTVTSTGTAPDGIPRPQPAPTTRTVQIRGTDGTMHTVRLPIGDEPLFQGPTSPSIKGQTQAQSDALEDRMANAVTPEDHARAAVARARLTPGDLSDDIYNTTILRDLLKTAMEGALADSDPRNDEAAIDAFLSVETSLNSLKEAVTANTDALDAQRRQYEALIAEDYRTKYNVSQSQYGILAQAVWDAANQFGGTRLGLGLSGLRAPAGSVARA